MRGQCLDWHRGFGAPFALLFLTRSQDHMLSPHARRQAQLSAIPAEEVMRLGLQTQTAVYRTAKERTTTECTSVALTAVHEDPTDL